MDHGGITSNPIVIAIIACEVGFWVLVLGGLAVRYLLHAPRLSRLMLLLVPVLDVVLLAVVAIDISSGSEVTTVHRLAGLYLGGTVAFGHTLIAAADSRFAQWFDGTPKTAKPPKGGTQELRNEVKLFGQWLLAAAVAAGAVLLLSVTVADAEQRTALLGIFPMLGVVTVIWLVTGPVWSLLTPAKADR